MTGLKILPGVCSEGVIKVYCCQNEASTTPQTTVDLESRFDSKSSAKLIDDSKLRIWSIDLKVILSIIAFSRVSGIF